MVNLYLNIANKQRSVDIIFSKFFSLHVPISGLYLKYLTFFCCQIYFLQNYLFLSKSLLSSIFQLSFCFSQKQYEPKPSYFSWECCICSLLFFLMFVFFVKLIPSSYNSFQIPWTFFSSVSKPKIYLSKFLKIRLQVKA